ncbi:MAG TPA: acylneuraminate cytidylyltransferase family protein [Fibrobacteria bacterium]|nr:acylneuraminate cytidylyltransferase family protein [Fibrobacteria bacterium]
MSGARNKIVALIPARAGSKRLTAKNVRLLGGHPLIAYTIAAARASGLFDAVAISTDSQEIAEICIHYGAESPFLRPESMAEDLSPDIEWLKYTLATLASKGRTYDAFALLRPTSPFRQAATIRRAWDRFSSLEDVDSLRAVELCKQHPAKMWVLEGGLMRPFLDDGGANPPWHSSAYQSLPPVYAQNASLEIAWSRIPLQQGSIAGKRITPFVTEGFEGFDINRTEDFMLAETLVDKGLASLPPVPQPAWHL